MVKQATIELSGPLTGPAYLTITEGKLSTKYVLVQLSTDFGTGFALARTDPTGDEDRDLYRVCLEEDRDWCDCPGHSRYGYCKHVRSLRSLVEKSCKNI